MKKTINKAKLIKKIQHKYHKNIGGMFMKKNTLSLDNIDIIKKSDNTYTIYEKSTGEIIDPNDARLDYIIKDGKKQNNLNKAKIKAINKSRGIIDITETHYINWKKQSNFIKVYRTEMREYKSKIKLSPSAGLLIFYLQDYIEYGTNKIIKSNGLNLSNSDIKKLTGLSTRTISSSLKELEDKLFIKRVGIGSARKIYFNPHLACSGNEIEKNTPDILFKDYKNVSNC